LWVTDKLRVAAAIQCHDARRFVADIGCFISRSEDYWFI
jgi:hypothetical protein